MTDINETTNIGGIGIHLFYRRKRWRKSSCNSSIWRPRL